MRQTPSQTRILDQLTADHNADEAAQMRAQLLTTSEGQGIFAGLHDAIHASDMDIPPYDVDASVHRFLERIAPPAQPALQPVVQPATPEARDIPMGDIPMRETPVRKSWGAWFASSAQSRLAGAALVTLLIALGWAGSRYQVGTYLAARNSTYTTNNGQQANITLPDGSTVVLNVGSRLDVPADYAMGNRTLKLSGEAFFNVIPQASKPFVVTAGPSTTRVLGTSFVVRHYPTDSTAVVAVRDGKVMTQSQVLTAQQRIEVDARGTGRIHQVSPAEFRFATGTLALDNVPLTKAALDLGRWYDADIRLGDASLVAQRVTGEFVPESLASLVNILELMLDVRVVREGRVLTLFPR